MKNLKKKLEVLREFSTSLIAEAVGLLALMLGANGKIVLISPKVLFIAGAVLFLIGGTPRYVAYIEKLFKKK